MEWNIIVTQTKVYDLIFVATFINTFSDTSHYVNFSSSHTRYTYESDLLVLDFYKIWHWFYIMHLSGNIWWIQKCEYKYYCITWNLAILSFHPPPKSAIFPKCSKISYIFIIYYLFKNFSVSVKQYVLIYLHLERGRSNSMLSFHIIHFYKNKC